MSKDNNYFGNLTNLFIKAKEEEQIFINPYSKNKIRENLELKISELKGEIVPKEEARFNLGDYWIKWKYQIVGIPVSLMALFVIVFAASNWQFTMPKEDFTPEVMTSITQEEDLGIVEEVVEEVFEEVKEPERDSVKFQTVKKPIEEKPELLVLDATDMGKVPARRLNKLPPSYTYQPESPQPYQPPLVEPVIIQEEPDDVSEPTNIVYSTKEEEETPQEEPGTPEEDTTIPDTKEESEATETDTAEEPEQEDNAQDTSDDKTAEEETSQEQETTDNTLSTDIPETEAVTQSALTTAEQTLQNQYIKDANEFVKAEITKYPIYYYRNDSLVKDPDFNQEMITNLINKKLPTTVNVYYISEDTVVIEVQENDTSKWFLFKKVGDNWTIQKYEKQTLAAMVK